MALLTASPAPCYHAAEATQQLAGWQGAKKIPTESSAGKCTKRPASRCVHSDQGRAKGSEDMDMNTVDLLVRHVQDAERLRILLMATECKTLEELIEKLRVLVSK